MGPAKSTSDMAQAVQRLATKVPQLAKAGADLATPRLQTFWKYAKVELGPPSLNQMPEVSKGFSNLLRSARTGKWQQVTVKEAAVNACVTIEVLCWFAIGECLGKRSLIGYQVPGGWHNTSDF